MNLFKRIFSALLTITVVIGLGFAWANRRDIQDWWALRDYTPPSDVVELADITTMTDGARRVFYVNNPLIVDEVQFNSACKPESTIVLGCYIPRDGIYLYDVDDPRLDGVKQVTAAHELLHAEYERLSADEKGRVDSLTQQTLSTITDQRILDTVEEYRKNDPSVVPNELHSILASEVRELPDELEEYYSKYFLNRQKIVEFSEKYEAEFSSRRDTVNQYDQQLAQLKLEIEAGQTDLNLQYQALQEQKNTLDALLDAGQTEEYNAQVPGFNQSVNSYNNYVRTVSAKISQYNTLVEKRNALAVEVQQLVESIDSRPESF